MTTLVGHSALTSPRGDNFGQLGPLQIFHTIRPRQLPKEEEESEKACKFEPTVRSCAVITSRPASSCENWLRPTRRVHRHQLARRLWVYSVHVFGRVRVHHFKGELDQTGEGANECPMCCCPLLRPNGGGRPKAPGWGGVATSEKGRGGRRGR